MERDKTVLLRRRERGSIPTGRYSAGSLFDAGRFSPPRGAVTRQRCREARLKERAVLLRNDRRVTQNELTRPTFTLSHLPSRAVPGFLLAAALMLVTGTECSPARAAPAIEPISTAVIKATTGLCLRGKTCHVNKAGTWVPDRDVAIVAASVAEQVDVALYVDIEISTRPEMYQCNETDAAGCIFRVKYSGPGLYVYDATAGNTYLGSNVTNTNITFPAGTGIVVKKGVPIYVHLDVRNGSLIDLKVDQDAWLYYLPLD